MKDSNELFNLKRNSIRSFYDFFPYEPTPIFNSPPKEFDWRFSFESVSSFCYQQIKKNNNKIKDSENLKILDAGCGTGVSTNFLAYQNKGSEILAIDISKNSLKMAENRLDQSGFDKYVRLEFQEKSILNMEDIGEFDYINSIGTLHHLDSPIDGLKALSSKLKDSGIIHLYLYSKRERDEIKYIQEFFKKLDINYKESVDLARRFFEELPDESLTKNKYLKDWLLCSKTDSSFADMFLNPFEKSFSVDSLFNLINFSGLKFIAFSNTKDWELKRFLKGELLEKASNLTKVDQLKLIEAIDPGIGNFDFFLVKNSF